MSHAVRFNIVACKLIWRNVLRLQLIKTNWNLIKNLSEKANDKENGFTFPQFQPNRFGVFLFRDCDVRFDHQFVRMNKSCRHSMPKWWTNDLFSKSRSMQSSTIDRKAIWLTVINVSQRRSHGKTLPEILERMVNIELPELTLFVLSMTGNLN